MHVQYTIKRRVALLKIRNIEWIDVTYLKSLCVIVLSGLMYLYNLCVLVLSGLTYLYNLCVLVLRTVQPARPPLSVVLGAHEPNTSQLWLKIN